MTRGRKYMDKKNHNKMKNDPYKQFSTFLDSKKSMRLRLWMQQYRKIENLTQFLTWHWPFKHTWGNSMCCVYSKTSNVQKILFLILWDFTVLLMHLQKKQSLTWKAGLCLAASETSSWLGKCGDVWKAHDGRVKNTIACCFTARYYYTNYKNIYDPYSRLIDFWLPTFPQTCFVQFVAEVPDSANHVSV